LLGHDGKEISDTRRYQMLGNSVCVSVVAYIMQGIAEQFGIGCGTGKVEAAKPE
jgi:site-specific DNA-cytosine methylase